MYHLIHKKLNYNTYEINEEYTWHIDASPKSPVKDIKLTCLLNCSEKEYEGGDLCLFRDGEMKIKEFKPGTTLIVPSFKNYKVEQVLESEAIWAVFYKGKPFNLKSGSMITSYPGPKYKKVSFSNSGHAFNLAERLNKIFTTDEFVVMKMTGGEPVTEQDLIKDINN